MIHRLTSLAIRGGLCMAAAGWSALAWAQAQQPDQPNLTPLPFPEIDTPSLHPPGMSPWLIAGGIVLVLILVALTVLLLMKSGSAKVPPPPLPPLRKALFSLEALQAQLDEIDPGSIGHEVSVILREYQQTRYQVPAPYLTTEELYGKGAYPTAEMRERYSPLAEVYDRLSFGRVPGDRDEAAALIQLAIAALQEERRYVHDDEEGGSADTDADADTTESQASRDAPAGDEAEAAPPEAVKAPEPKLAPVPPLTFTGPSPAVERLSLIKPPPMPSGVVADGQASADEKKPVNTGS